MAHDLVKKEQMTYQNWRGNSDIQLSCEEPKDGLIDVNNIWFYIQIYLIWY